MFTFGALFVPAFADFKVVGEGVIYETFDHGLYTLPPDVLKNALTLNWLTWLTATEQFCANTLDFRILEAAWLPSVQLRRL